MLIAWYLRLSLASNLNLLTDFFNVTFQVHTFHRLSKKKKNKNTHTIYSTKQSLSREDDGSLTCQEIIRTLILKAHCRIQKISLLVRLLLELNLVQTFIFFKIHFNTILPFTSRSYK
jgi:uncharacterized membrane protein